MISITAVIPTRNRAGLLRSAIDSLIDQTAERGSYEILVVDNGSTDGTPALCEEYSGRDSRFRWVREQTPGLSQAKNRALAECSAPVIAYMDDDARAVPGWIQAVVDGFELAGDTGVCVGGPVIPDWEAPPPPWLPPEARAMLSEIDWGDEARPLGPDEYVGGGNSAFRVNVLRQARGFSTSLGRKPGSLLSNEEILLRGQLEAAGGTYFYNPPMRIDHFTPRCRTQRRYLLRRAFWQGVSNERTRSARTETPLRAVSRWPLLKRSIRNIGYLLSHWYCHEARDFKRTMDRAQALGSAAYHLGLLRGRV